MPHLGPAHSNPSMLIAGLTLTSALAITACHDQSHDTHPSSPSSPATSGDGTGDSGAFAAEPKMGPPRSGAALMPTRVRALGASPLAAFAKPEIGALDAGSDDAAADGQVPDAGSRDTTETGGSYGGSSGLGDAGSSDGGRSDAGSRGEGPRAAAIMR